MNLTIQPIYDAVWAKEVYYLYDERPTKALAYCFEKRDAEALRARLDIRNFVVSEGMGSKEVEAVYVFGPIDREDEGIVGHDMRVRPVRLGFGPYTFVCAPDALEECGP